MHISIKATIKLNPVYTCSKCGKNQVGDPMCLDFRGNSVDELNDFISNIRQTSKYMPVGWSYGGKFTCGCDKK